MGWGGGQRRWDPHDPLRTRDSSSPSLPWGRASPGHPWIPGEGGKKALGMGQQHRGGCSTPKGGAQGRNWGQQLTGSPSSTPSSSAGSPCSDTRLSTLQSPWGAHVGSVGSPQAPQLLTFSPLAPGGPAMAWGTGERGVRLGGALLHPSDQGKAAGSPALTCPGAPASPGSPLGPAGPEGPGTPWHKAGSPQPVLSPGGLAGGCPTPLPSCRASRALRPSPTRRPDPARPACRSPPADGTAGIWGCEHPIAPQPLGAGFPMG